MPVTDLDLISDAAQQAAEIALKYWRTDQRVDYKDGGSPVSEGDFAVDAFLRSNLLAARPDYGWLSEETEDDQTRLMQSRTFIVDPIDGTRAYVNGEITWSISIAVVENGQPTAGVVYLPARDKLYLAAAGQGATLNGNAIETGTNQDPEGAQVLANKKALDPQWWAQTPPNVKRNFRPSLAYRFCLVAEGRYDALLTVMDAHEWDIAAGVLIAQEAGAKNSDRNGDAIQFNAPTPKAAGVFTAPQEMHNRLITLYTGRAPR